MPKHLSRFAKSVLQHILLTSAFVCLLSAYASGAEISANPGAYGPEQNIFFHGPIVPGDAERFRSVVLDSVRSGHYIGGVLLYSSGGDVGNALYIGQQIRVLKASTHAPYRVQCSGMPHITCDCFSACFLVWAAGVGRFGDMVGIHRFHFDPASYQGLPMEQAQRKYEVMQRTETEYLRRMDIPDWIIQLQFTTASVNGRYLTAQELAPLLGVPVWLEELAIARCGTMKTNPSGYLACSNPIYEEESRKGVAEYLRLYGN